MVQTVKNPRSHKKSASQDASSRTDKEKLQLDFMLPKSAETESMKTPGRYTPQWETTSDMSVQDSDKKSRKSARVSLKG